MSLSSYSQPLLGESLRLCCLRQILRILEDVLIQTHVLEFLYALMCQRFKSAFFHCKRLYCFLNFFLRNLFLRNIRQSSVEEVDDSLNADCRKLSDRKSTRLNSSQVSISYYAFCVVRCPPRLAVFPYTTLFRSYEPTFLSSSMHSCANGLNPPFSIASASTAF